MGVWGPGVFGNDWTADFVIEFDGTKPAGRVDLLRDALNEALATDIDDLEECAGAARRTLAIGTGGPVGVDASLGVPADLVPLALRAFDRVVGEEAEYAEMWNDANFAPALHEVRDALSAGVTL